MRKLLALVMSVSVISAVGISTSQAATVNQKCSKSGQVSGTGSMKLTCKKVGSTLRWVSTPTPVPTKKSSTVGSFKSPVPANTVFRVGDVKLAIIGSQADVSAQVCEANYFNSGCDVNDNYDGIVDPDASGYWISILVSANNNGDDIVRPNGFDFNYKLVLSNGQLQTEGMATGMTDRLSDISLVPGGTATGSVYFYMPKTQTSVPDLVLVSNYASILNSSQHYFRIPK